MQRLPRAGFLPAGVLLFLSINPPATAAPRHAHKASGRHATSEQTRGKKTAHKASRRVSPKARRHGKIYQDASGSVAFDRFGALPVYGPFLPPVVYDYPRLPCEPVDAPIEARLHDPQEDAEVAAEGQAELADLMDEDAPAPAERETRVGKGLSLVAEKLGSLFRPKSSEAVVKPQDVDLTELVSQNFEIPVEGVDAQKLRDSFLSARGRHRKHLAIDIGAPRGTPVLATTDGEIVRISRERRAGKAIYQKDSTGEYLLFYCHLSRYANALAAGDKVKKGDVIGYVGATGHVIGGPHLHFSVTRLPEEGSFRQGLAINPYLLFLAGVP
ncbi:MAG TPA: M23 family metallopeptidase [Thermoanaerobaculia bacterium]|nr:M23 family metallopeptidase [Thermoanaerobaculia bacterium]